MKISFYLRQTTVYARISHKSDMVRVTTGIKPSMAFKLTGDRFEGNNIQVAALNADLDKFRASINELFVYHNGDLQKVRATLVGEVTKPEDRPTDENYNLDHLLMLYIDMANAGEIKSRKGTKLSQSTISTYRFAVNVYLRYQGKNKPVDLTYFSLDGKVMKEKQTVADMFTKHFEKLEIFMVKEEFAINTRHDVMNILSIIINYWCEKLFIRVPSLPKLGKHETAIVVLDDRFLAKFVTDEHKLYQSMDRVYKYIWEVCSVIMVTSLRVSDAVAITKDDLEFVNNGVFLQKKNQKTGEYTTTPLPPAICNWMYDNMAKYGTAYTPIQKTVTPQAVIRRHMAEFFKQYDEMHELVTVRVSSVDNRAVPVTKPMYEWVHPHMLRKTAITAMIANGVSIDHVKFASGHSQSSTSFNRYVGWVDRHYKSGINNYQDKMFAKST
jgi:integrase